MSDINVEAYYILSIFKKHAFDRLNVKYISPFIKTGKAFSEFNHR